MGNKDTALFVAGVVFALVAILHGMRLWYHWDIVVSDWLLPMWVSYPGLIVALLLSIWMFTARSVTR